MPGRTSETKIYVGNLHSSVTPSELKKLFEEHGTVSSCERAGGPADQFAFIYIDGEDGAKAAVNALNGQMLAGQALRVELSLNATPLGIKLFVGQVADSSADKLKELFSAHGKVIRCDKIQDYAFVHMATKEQAVDAVKALNGFEISDGNFLKVEISVKDVRPLKAKLFVGNLAEGTTKTQIRDLFNQYGTVVDCIVKKSFAFVHMDSIGNAREAMKNLNGETLNERDMRVQPSDSQPRHGADYPPPPGAPRNRSGAWPYPPRDGPFPPPRGGGGSMRGGAGYRYPLPAPYRPAQSPVNAHFEAHDRYRHDYNRFQNARDDYERERFREYCMQDLDIIQKYESLRRGVEAPRDYDYSSDTYDNFNPQRY